MLDIKNDNTLRLCGFKIHSTIIFNTSRVETLALSNITPSLENHLSLVKLIDSCRVLRVLKFDNVPALNDEFFSESVKHGLFNQVVSLEISNSGEDFSEISMNYIAKFCFRLEVFIFNSNNDLITEENLLEVVRANKGLKEIRINFNKTDSSCTDRILGSITRSCKQLEVLELAGTVHVSVEAVTGLLIKARIGTLVDFKFSTVYTPVNPNPNYNQYGDQTQFVSRTASFRFEQDHLMESRHLTLKGPCFTDSPPDNLQYHYYQMVPGTSDEYLKTVFKEIAGLTHLSVQRTFVSDFIAIEFIAKLNPHLQRLYMTSMYEFAQCHTIEMIFLKIPQLVTFIQVPMEVDPQQQHYYGGYQNRQQPQQQPVETRNPALPVIGGFAPAVEEVDDDDDLFGGGVMAVGAGDNLDDDDDDAMVQDGLNADGDDGAEADDVDAAVESHDVVDLTGGMDSY